MKIVTICVLCLSVTLVITGLVDDRPVSGKDHAGDDEGDREAEDADGDEDRHGLTRVVVGVPHEGHHGTPHARGPCDEGAEGDLRELGAVALPKVVEALHHESRLHRGDQLSRHGAGAPLPRWVCAAGAAARRGALLVRSSVAAAATSQAGAAWLVAAAAAAAAALAAAQLTGEMGLR